MACLTARQAPDTHGNSLPFVLCPWGPLPWLRGNQGLPPVPSGTVREVWTKPGLLGPDRPPGLEPGGIPEERRTLPAEWFNPHSFHKQPLSTHGAHTSMVRGRNPPCRTPHGEHGVFGARSPSEEGPRHQHSLLWQPLGRARVPGAEIQGI